MKNFTIFLKRNTTEMLKVLLVVVGVVWSLNGYSQIYLIDPAGDGGFETGSTLAINNWTSVQSSQTNTICDGSV